MKRARVAPILDVFARLGCEVVEVTVTGTTHYKVVASWRGHRRFFITSSTPSDVRTMRNLTTTVRRWQKALVPQEPQT